MPKGGFTLIEVVLVLAVAGVLIAIAIPAYDRYIYRARVVETIVDVSEISRRIRQHEAAKGALPNALADVDLGAKVDAWGRPYEYFNLRTAKGNGKARSDQKLAPLNSDFDLYSVGRDGDTAKSLGNKASRDDIVRARDGAFVGLAEEFDP